MTTENTADFSDGGERNPAAELDFAALFDLGKHPEQRPGANPDTLTKLTVVKVSA